MLAEVNCFCLSNITVITHSSAQHVEIYICLPAEGERLVLGTSFTAVVTL